MKNVVTLICLFCTLLATLPGCSQRHGIYKSSAYSRTSTGGAQRVGEDGRPVKRPPLTELLIFIQTDSSTPPPIIEQAWIGPAAYSVSVIVAPAVPELLGTVKADQTQATLPTGVGRTVYQLTLNPLPAAAPDEATARLLQKNQVVLRGTWKGKTFRHGIPHLTELDPLILP
jgi:hypothetical protein